MSSAADAAPRFDSLVFRRATLDDAVAVKAVEDEGFLASEAASLEAVRFRMRTAGEFFYVLLHGAESSASDECPVVGFVNGTKTTQALLTHDSMHEHEADGTTLCIHSVCVRPRYHRKGLGLALLRRYVTEMQREFGASGALARMLLICKKHMIPFYEQAGFALDGPSDVVHGPDPWFQMSQAGAPKPL